MFRFLTAGESHGPSLTAIIDGLPAGVAIDIDAVNAELARRQRGYGRGGRMQIERDQVEILSGVRHGQTLGSPVTLAIHNVDWDNWQEIMSAAGPSGPGKLTAPRPGHADLAGVLKYGRQDARDILERASARETAARVAVGAIAKQFLRYFDIKILSHVVNIGGITINNKTDNYETLERAGSGSELACVDTAAEAKMKAAIAEAREQGDSLGGIFEVIGYNILPGLGSHVQWDRRLDTRIAAAIMSIPAVKGVEIGAGFDAACLPGSKVHDEIHYAPGTGFFRKTNRAGGIEGGISNGENIVVRAAMKPIPTLMRPIASIDIATRQPVSAAKERSDVCAVPAAGVVGEAMLAVVLAEALLEKFGGDNIDDIIAAVEYYRRRLAGGT